MRIFIKVSSFLVHLGWKKGRKEGRKEGMKIRKKGMKEGRNEGRKEEEGVRYGINSDHPPCCLNGLECAWFYTA